MGSCGEGDVVRAEVRTDEAHILVYTCEGFARSACKRVKEMSCGEEDDVRSDVRTSDTSARTEFVLAEEFTGKGML